MNGSEAASDEYDSYVAPVCGMLLNAVDERRLADYLSGLRRNAMGLSHADTEGDLLAARRLIAAGAISSQPRHAVRNSQELLQRYGDGERDFSGSDMETDWDHGLNGNCLDGVRLQDSWLSESFVGASLRGSCFRGSNVKASDFSNADLRGSDFRDALLCGTLFLNARLEQALFEGASYHNHWMKDGEVPDW